MIVFCPMPTFHPTKDQNSLIGFWVSLQTDRQTPAKHDIRRSAQTTKQRSIIHKLFKFNTPYYEANVSCHQPSKGGQSMKSPSSSSSLSSLQREEFSRIASRRCDMSPQRFVLCQLQSVGHQHSRVAVDLLNPGAGDRPPVGRWSYNIFSQWTDDCKT